MYVTPGVCLCVALHSPYDYESFNSSLIARTSEALRLWRSADCRRLLKVFFLDYLQLLVSSVSLNHLNSPLSIRKPFDVVLNPDSLTHSFEQEIRRFPLHPIQTGWAVLVASLLPFCTFITLQHLFHFYFELHCRTNRFIDTAAMEYLKT